MKIVKVAARQIFDSRGYPTIEVDTYLSDGSMGRAAVPSGASKGSHEALELRDKGIAYDGKGVNRAIRNIQDTIAPKVVGMQANEQALLDKTLIVLDSTADKSKLGANAILGVSLATAKAAANYKKQPFFRYVADLYKTKDLTMPLPMVNILNGGRHARGSTTIQEFMMVPCGAKNIQEALQMCSEVFHRLGKVLTSLGYQTRVGDEGGYAPPLKFGNKQALDVICESIVKCGYKPGKDVALAIDVAASGLYDGKTYCLEPARSMNARALIDWYAKLADEYPLISIEDGLDENDWQNWQKLTIKLGNRLQLVGDDLLATNTNLLKRAISLNAANSILIKPNQIGTLSETVEAVRTAQSAGWRTIISHRSGETEDTTIAHLAVGLGAAQIKTGSFSRSERLAKYNELLRIREIVPHAPLYRF